MTVLAQFLAAIVFYTCLPVPATWSLNFQAIAKFAPLIGVGIGCLLALLDWGLCGLGMPPLTRSALVIVTWVALTGGLHLDGAIDTADGLAVQDPDRRLAVMADSVTGAFGAMAAVVVLILKITALSDLSHDRGLALILAAGWGRWGQLWAIVRYPYLKPTGKGAFHKEAIHSYWDTLPSLLLLIALSTLPTIPFPTIPFPTTSLFPSPHLSISLLPFALCLLCGLTLATLTGAWLNHKLGGQTGDTYGAIVEWTEALFLCSFTLIPAIASRLP